MCLDMQRHNNFDWVKIFSLRLDSRLSELSAENVVRECGCRQSLHVEDIQNINLLYVATISVRFNNGNYTNIVFPEQKVRSNAVILQDMEKKKTTKRTKSLKEHLKY